MPRTSGAASITIPAYSQLMTIRQLSTVHVPNYDFSTVDRFLARLRFCIELASTDDCGPRSDHASVVILEPEYASLVEVASFAKLHALPEFNRRLYMRTMVQLCAAVGRNVLVEWGEGKTFHFQ